MTRNLCEGSLCTAGWNVLEDCIGEVRAEVGLEDGWFGHGGIAPFQVEESEGARYSERSCTRTSR